MSRRRGQTAPVVTPGTWDVFTVDRTGNTVVHPIYSDILPINAVYIAPRSGQPVGTTAGDDATGDGTISAPYASITKALQSTTSSKQYIVVRGGTIGGAGHETDAQYSSGGIFNARTVTIQPYRDEQAWFNGNHVVDKFCIFGCNGNVMTHTVRGIGFRGYIANANSGTSGVIHFSSGTNNNAIQIIEDFVIRDTDGVGLNFFKPRGDRGSRCTRGVVRDIDSTGITGTHLSLGNFTATKPNEPSWAFRNDMKFEDLYITNTNRGDHRGGPSDGGYAGSFQGAIKIHGYLGCYVTGCIIEDIGYSFGTGAFGVGVWFDVGNKECYVACNFIRRTAHAAIQFEVDHTGYAVSNICEDNGHGSNSHGNIYIASPHSQAWHNTCVRGGNSISWYDDVRSLACQGYGWNTVDLTQKNNIFAGPVSQSYLGRCFRFSPENCAGDYTRPGAIGDASSDDFWTSGHWQNNGWYKNGTTNTFQWDDRPDTASTSYSTAAALNADHGEVAATDINTSSDPFIDLANRNYHVNPGHAFHLAGIPLPANIAALIPGAVAGQVYDLGYIDAPVPTWA